MSSLSAGLSAYNAVEPKPMSSTANSVRSKQSSRPGRGGGDSRSQSQYGGPPPPNQQNNNDGHVSVAQSYRSVQQPTVRSVDGRSAQSVASALSQGTAGRHRGNYPDDDDNRSRDTARLMEMVDDVTGNTLCADTTTSKKLSDQLNGKTKSQKAAFIGGEIARLAKDKNVTEVVLDRGYSRFHGRVKALADAAREAGLQL